MKIFDCFMYFDEEVVLDVRLNTLNEFVDYFVIVESKYLARIFNLSLQRIVARITIKKGFKTSIG